jgi:hypothetical protein
MRFLYLIAFIILGSAIGILAYENRELMTIQYFGQSVACPAWLTIAIVYLLGTVTGLIALATLQHAFRHRVASSQ